MKRGLVIVMSTMVDTDRIGKCAGTGPGQRGRSRVHDGAVRCDR